jgi:hypothetical protein
MDPLAFTSIRNILRSDENIQKLDSIVEPNGLPSTLSEAKTSIDEILSYTTIKRAACLGLNEVRVRVPIHNEVDMNEEVNKQMYNTYRYYDKPVNIPDAVIAAATSQGYVPDSDQCNNFYKLYCRNIVKMFKDQNGGGFDSAVFSDYKPECACHGEMPPEVVAQGNIAPKCLLSGCTVGSPGVHVDSLSKVSDCELTLCNSSQVFNNLEAGGDVGISTRINQTCGRNATAGENPGQGAGQGAGQTTSTAADAAADAAAAKAITDAAVAKAIADAATEATDDNTDDTATDVVDTTGTFMGIDIKIIGGVVFVLLILLLILMKN